MDLGSRTRPIGFGSKFRAKTAVVSRPELRRRLDSWKKCFLAHSQRKERKQYASTLPGIPKYENKLMLSPSPIYPRKRYLLNLHWNYAHAA